MYYAKITTIKWVEVTNLNGDTYYLLPELLEDDGSGGFELGPSPITDSMEKAKLVEKAKGVRLRMEERKGRLAEIPVRLAAAKDSYNKAIEAAKKAMEEAEKTYKQTPVS